MKRKNFMFLALISISVSAYSQFSAGISAGAGPGFIREDINSEDQFVHTAKATPGYYGGLYLRYDFAHFFLQVTPSYLVKGKVKFSNSTSEIVSSANDKIYLPLAIGKRFFPGFRIYIGGGIEILLTDALEAYEFFEEIYDATEYYDYDSFEYYNPNMQVGATWDFEKLGIGLQYCFGLYPDFYLQLSSSTGEIGGSQFCYLSTLFLTVNYKLF